MIPVILSGGSGSRLWPKSRKEYPKQFLSLTDGEHTMIQETALRLRGLETGSPLVVSNENHRFIVAEQLSAIGAPPQGILLEPCARNTAPAVTLAALFARRDGENPLLLVLPADHVIDNVPAFHKAVSDAADAARQGSLVTFGIVPTRAETGYGYVKSGAAVAGMGSTCEVARFIEKPPQADADSFIKQGGYFWNSGMFMFTAERFLQEMETFNPEIVSQCREALDRAEIDRDFTWLDEAAFADCPEDSIDYAVMEKTDAAVVVPMDAGWSDVGSWQSLWDIQHKDSRGNVCRGDVLAVDSNNCMISGDKRLVAALGVDDLVIVDSDDALMVTRRECSQDVKKLVAALEKNGDVKHLVHRKVFRPWGHYDSVDEGDRFQVKRITVKPGEKLSLQMHHHRAEHWIVVRGTAKVTCGEEEILLSENQSTFIPLGVRHRLENPGKVNLEIIEVQSGAYLGEDDIVRFDDTYGRH